MKLKYLILQLKAFIKLYIIRDKRKYYLSKWYLDNAEIKIRYSHRLDSESIVFDVGGFIGEWSEAINSKYKSKIFIFEPIREYYEICRIKFLNYKNVKVFEYGLGASSYDQNISINGPASTTFKRNNSEHDKSEMIKIRSIIDFIAENNINNIDLIKINIEGMEYELLESIINSGFIKIISNLQIQFHNFQNDHSIRREEIRNKLELTHINLYNYPFVWEGWERKVEGYI